MRRRPAALTDASAGALPAEQHARRHLATRRRLRSANALDLRPLAGPGSGAALRAGEADGCAQATCVLRAAAPRDLVDLSSSAIQPVAHVLSAVAQGIELLTKLRALFGRSDSTRESAPSLADEIEKTLRKAARWILVVALTNVDRLFSYSDLIGKRSWLSFARHRAFHPPADAGWADGHPSVSMTVRPPPPAPFRNACTSAWTRGPS